ncbi:MAG TPA: PLP-dependent aminotransferase family protein [Chryseolinea sp.]
MIFLKQLIAFDKSSNIALYLQITNSIIHNIRMGRIRKGLKFPGSRQLAEMLKVHRKTILAAFDELLAQGWIETIPRKGTFVVKDLPEIKPKKIKAAESTESYRTKAGFSFQHKELISFPEKTFQASPLIIDDGFPDVRLAPNDLFFREIRRLGMQSAFKKYFHYGNPKGPDYLLQTLASVLSDTRGLPITTDNIMITKGAQMSMYLAAKLLLQPGSNVVVGEPGYFAATITFQHAGANIHRVPVDALGIDVDAIETLARKKKIALVYVIPHHHQPTTVTLSPERRIRLLELAAANRFAIIEDDYDYDFHYASSPLLPMASLDHHGNVIYIGTLTKTLAPAIRTGFMVAPENFINAAAYQRRWVDRQGDNLTEVALAELYRNGTMASHIRKVVKIYHERRDHFCAMLKQKLGDRISFDIPGGGMSVWATFHHADIKQVAAKAEKKGLLVSDGRLYNLNKDYNATRLGFASLNLKEQEKAIDILAKCV